MLETKSDLVTMAILGGAFLGVLLFAGPQIGHCGADIDCLFGLSNVFLRGAALGGIAGFLLGGLLALGTSRDKGKN